MPSSKFQRQDALIGQSQVARIMGRAEAIEEEAKPFAGRGKPGHAGKKGMDKKGRTKLTADLHPATADQFRQLAEETGIALSDLVEAALRGFVNGHRARQIDLGPYLIRARSLKAEWNLELPDKFTLFSP